MNENNQTPVALITGAAKRIGAIIAKSLHGAGYNIVLHYRHSGDEANELARTLNNERPESAMAAQADFSDPHQIKPLIENAHQTWQRLDVLINNASDFFPNTFGETTPEQWQLLHSSNLMAPFFLAQAAMPYLKETQGNIINMSDVNTERPRPCYSAYSILKSGINMLTKILAKELGPNVRVNAIAPAETIWPADVTKDYKDFVMENLVLDHTVNPQEIANTVLFLLRQSSFTGEIIHIDCGRRLF